jgi:ribosomal protein S21
MLIVKVERNNIEKALKTYKGKVIKTKQMSKLNDNKEFIKKSVKKRNVLSKAKYVNKTKNSDDN